MTRISELHKEWMQDEEYRREYRLVVEEHSRVIAGGSRTEPILVAPQVAKNGTPTDRHKS